ncbi:hypothetical protein C0J52_03217 [Blattella germanica]|nr:hypothetical protein C0J52_03217 [Blattella germanica]
MFYRFSHVKLLTKVSVLELADSNLGAIVLRAEDHSQIKKIFPAAEFITVSGAGHWVHADKPNELLAILQDFIQTENVSS